MKEQLESLMAQSDILAKTVRKHIDQLDMEDCVMLTSSFHNLVTNLECLLDRQAIKVDYSLGETSGTQEYERSDAGEQMVEARSSRDEYTVLNITTDMDSDSEAHILLSTLPKAEISHRLSTGSQVFQNLSFASITKDRIIPFDKTLNFDVMEFVERIRMDSPQQKPISLDRRCWRTNGGFVFYQNGLKTFKLSTSNNSRYNSEVVAGPPRDDEIEIYQDIKYLGKYLNRDRNLAVVENRFIFYISWEQIRMIDINRLIIRGRISCLISLDCENPAFDVNKRRSVSIYVDHRDGVLYSIDEQGRYSMYKLLSKEFTGFAKFENLALLATRATEPRTFDEFKFTCITGKSGLVATASFDSNKEKVVLYLLEGIRGKRLGQVIFSSSVPIHRMQFAKVKSLRVLLTYDYDGKIRVFSVSHDGLVFDQRELITNITHIKLRSNETMDLDTPILEKLYLYFKHASVNSEDKRVLKLYFPRHNADIVDRGLYDWDGYDYNERPRQNRGFYDWVGYDYNERPRQNRVRLHR